MRYIEIDPSFNGTVLVCDNGTKPPLEANQVLIHVAAAGINRADLLQAEGKYPAPEEAPANIPGLEISGTIIEIGSTVTDFYIGDTVCALLAGGGYSEYVAVDTGSILPVPQHFDTTQAAALPEALFTVWLALHTKARIKKGERVLIHCGASGIGSFAIQIAKALGCEVYATASSVEKRVFLCELGADKVLDYRTDNWHLSLKKEIGPIDIILDPLGGAYTQQNISLLGYGGRYISIAVLANKMAHINMASILMKNLSVHGMTLRSQPDSVKKRLRDELYTHIWPLINNSEIVPHIDRYYSISEAQEAHDFMRSNMHKGKIVLTFD